MSHLSRLLMVSIACGALLVPASSGRAFCGFYVAGANGALYANATMVVMMRHGQRTVLSMQNNYQGPPQDFAMVVPVPVVLHEENVKTLSREVFTHVDQIAAPRLVEYWEQDPCFIPRPSRMMMRGGGTGAGMAAMADMAPGSAPAVRIEAQFAVAEYDIVILSADDSTALETWLRQEHYNIPVGASAALAPYVAAGTKFFVAKVDAQRVTFANGQAVLSPLRFHYDTPEFSLPIRLGLLNSQGEQDLIVHIISENGHRFEVANFGNVAVPTNIVVKERAKANFPGFYEALFARTLRENPGKVVTEYAWDYDMRYGMTCDPCTAPPIAEQEFQVLGGDVITGSSMNAYQFSLTRLHHRYTKNGLREDLVFREAPALRAISGGPNARGALQREIQTNADPNARSTYQARYAVLHPWTAPTRCASPVRGRWGGPPNNARFFNGGSGGPDIHGAPASGGLLQGRRPRPINLEDTVRQRVPEIRLTPTRVSPVSWFFSDSDETLAVDESPTPVTAQLAEAQESDSQPSNDRRAVAPPVVGRAASDSHARASVLSSRTTLGAILLVASLAVLFGRRRNQKE